MPNAQILNKFRQKTVTDPPKSLGKLQQ